MHMTQTFIAGQTATASNPGGRTVTGTYQGIDPATGCHLVEWTDIESRSHIPAARRVGAFAPRTHVGRFTQVSA
jgi:hypothetical protein